MIELTLFLYVHQPKLVQHKPYLEVQLKSFFKSNLFPLAKTWILNISEVALSEYDEPLLLETPPHSCLSKEQIMKVRKLIQKSSGINPEVTFNNMASKLGSFHCSIDFKIELFLPQWWLGVREEWNKIFTDFLVKKIKEGLKLKPSVGFFNLTDAIIPAVTLEILNKGPKFVPYTLPDTPQVKDFEENLYKQVFWLFSMLEKDSGPIPQFSHMSFLLQYLVSHTNGNNRDLFNSI